MRRKPATQTLQQRWLISTLQACVVLALVFLAHSTCAGQQAPAAGPAIKPPSADAVFKQLSTQGARALGLNASQQALAILLLTLVIAGAVMLWKRRKNAKPGAGPKSELAPVVPLTAAAPLTGGQLRGVWLRFLRRLPRIYRRSILNFQPYVVLGTAGAGKSRAIAAYTDWERQTKQFLASESTHPDLQVFLCSQAVVLELPSKVLHDSSDSARNALVRLWRPLFRRRSPIVVVPIDVSTLAKLPPESIRNLAYVVRGKVNVLDSVRRKRANAQPLEVRVLLTHLDSVEGFDDFARFAEQQNVPLRFELGPLADSPHVENLVVS